jgi:hypothetical protein
VLGAVLAVLVRVPERQGGLHSVRGHRVLRVTPHAVRALEVTLDGRRFAARRRADAWEIDGQPASARTAEALGDLVATLARLRAVDAFRPREAASFGLDRPRGTILVETPRGTRRLVLGSTNAAASALYARRDGDPRVIQVGIMLLSEIERVFYTRPATRPT